MEWNRLFLMWLVDAQNVQWRVVLDISSYVDNETMSTECL